MCTHACTHTAEKLTMPAAASSSNYAQTPSCTSPPIYDKSKKHLMLISNIIHYRTTVMTHGSVCVTQQQFIDAQINTQWSEIKQLRHVQSSWSKNPHLYEEIPLNGIWPHSEDILPKPNFEAQGLGLPPVAIHDTASSMPQKKGK